MRSSHSRCGRRHKVENTLDGGFWILLIAHDVAHKATPQIPQHTLFRLLGFGLVDEAQLDAVDTHALDLGQGTRRDARRVSGDDENLGSSERRIRGVAGVADDASIGRVVIRQEGDAGEGFGLHAVQGREGREDGAVDGRGSRHGGRRGSGGAEGLHQGDGPAWIGDGAGLGAGGY